MEGVSSPAGTIAERIGEAVVDVLGTCPGEFDADSPFLEMGFDSLSLARLATRLSEMFGVELLAPHIFACQNVSALSLDVLERLKTTHPPGAHAITARQVVNAEDRYPLAIPQQRLWYLMQLDASASQAYNMPLALRLRGRLNRSALRAALDRIVARHESLRTRFVVIEGQPVQRVAAAGVGFALREQLARNVSETWLRRLLSEEAAREFDLESGPPLRGALFELTDEEHVLLVTIHHIVTDGWSMTVFLRELGALYAAFCAGAPDPLAPLATQYPRYAQWHRGWLQGKRLEDQARFWRATLEGAPPLLTLKTDRTRPEEPEYAGADVGLVFERPLVAQLKALSQRHGVTLYMTMLAGLVALLSRLSGQDDVVIGTPVANRKRSDVEGLIGFFVNTLAIRVNLSGTPHTIELLRRVKRQVLLAQANADLPFEQVVKLLKSDRSMSQSPIFQVMFAWLNMPEPLEPELPGLNVEVLGVSTGTAQFDLAINLREHGGELAGSVNYATALFERGTIEDHVQCWKRLLEGMVADPWRAVNALPIGTKRKATEA